MNVAGVEINVGDTNTQSFLQGRQRAMNTRWYFSTRVYATRFLLGVQQQDFTVVVVGDTIHRTLRTERTANIIALAQQPLGQDRLADLPLLLPVVRQRRLLSLYDQQYGLRACQPALPSEMTVPRRRRLDNPLHLTRQASAETSPGCRRPC